jgi:hypothetical protein
MELLAPSLSHACILAICTDPCLHPGDHYRYRLTPSIVQQREPVSNKAPQQDASFGTWLALGAEIITIGKYSSGATLVYIPSQDTFYFASPPAMLSPECPEQTIFVGQFVIDGDATPRVLVFDVAKIQGVLCAGMPVRDRYACLQQKLAMHLGPICTPQWVGDCRVLAKDMGSGKFRVPHAVKGVMALQSEPGKLMMLAATEGVGGAAAKKNSGENPPLTQP